MQKNDYEHQEQVKVIAWAHAYKEQIPKLHWLYATPNGEYRPIPVAKRLKAEGVKRGVADLHLPIPLGGYAGLWIEMKNPDGKISKDQHEFLAAMTLYGHKCAVCYSANEAIAVLADYLGIAPKAGDSLQ